MDSYTLPLQHHYAQHVECAHQPCEGTRFPKPHMLVFNRALADALELPSGLNSAQGAAWLSGHQIPPGARPVAMAYAGHQFGQFVPQLGDGRALLLGELPAPDGGWVDLHLKGSGRTPFSRGGDGRCALGPALREYLVSEAMHHLGVPTTRSLAVVTTGEQVHREGLKPGAVLARIAQSHLRVGSLQYPAARGDVNCLRRLADFAIQRHDPDLSGQIDRYAQFLQRVCRRQAALVAHWMSLGFIHGVMNTDNTTLSGETIDYGPCAFMDRHDPHTAFSSIDHGGRYAYGNQPRILQWNLARLAETLLPLMHPEDPEQAVPEATRIIEQVPNWYQQAWRERMQAKTGLNSLDEEATTLLDALPEAMATSGIDHTLFFRTLAQATTGDTQPVLDLCQKPQPMQDWLQGWHQRLLQQEEDAQSVSRRMEQVNPLYIPRNHQVEQALETAVEQGDTVPLRRLLQVLQQPFTPQPGMEELARPAPEDFQQGYRTFCGT